LTKIFNFLIILSELRVGLSKKTKKEVSYMAIERWRPFTELMSLRQAMDKLFEDSFVRPSRALTALGEVTVPALDIYQTPSEVVVKATLPGVKPEDVSIDITGETLTIKGETKAEEEVKKEDYLYQERRNNHNHAPLSDFNKSTSCLRILAVAPQMICPSHS
jgi:HSP20 family molecular chaperone IbpA